MPIEADHRPLDVSGCTPESVDLDDPDAVRRAITLHQAGKAVFAVPFNTSGPGTLTWLDPHDRAER